MRFGLASVFLFLAVFQASGQHPILDNMTVVQDGSIVFISWTISSGETCNGITIERAVNDANYIEIGYIDGECGNPGFAVPYSFTDNSPLSNSVNRYRLDLGGRGYTDEAAVFYVDTRESGYFLSANPILPDTRLYIANTRAEQWALDVYDLSGRGVYQAETRLDFFLFHPDDFPSGMMVFVLTDGKQQYSGKFIVK